MDLLQPPGTGSSPLQPGYASCRITHEPN